MIDFGSEAERVARALGGRRSGRGWIARCPAHVDRRPSLSIAEGQDGALLLHCFAGCSFGAVLGAARSLGAIGRDRCAAAPVDQQQLAAARAREAEDLARRQSIARRIWDTAQPVAGTLVERYLSARAITERRLVDVRFARTLAHRSGQAAPAMIAAIRDASQRLIGVHRTWLRMDGGGKAPLEPAKAMLGRAMGGSVLLREGDGSLVVAEGVETALSLACAAPEARIFAALSAANLPALPLPSRPGEMIIGADGDPPGRTAALTLADRAATLGWRVRILQAPDGLDWSDVLRRAVGEARDDAA